MNFVLFPSMGKLSDIPMHVYDQFYKELLTGWWFYATGSTHDRGYDIHFQTTALCPVC